jgi:hypothetical protein
LTVLLVAKPNQIGFGDGSRNKLLAAPVETRLNTPASVFAAHLGRTEILLVCSTRNARSDFLPEGRLMKTDRRGSGQ